MTRLAVLRWLVAHPRDAWKAIEAAALDQALGLRIEAVMRAAAKGAARWN